ncbi:unnamed protein product [Rotaria magnacalcarata]|uniref:HAT C-terminal dimerisation domain-containing protein n=1 Tax=Rotaria magnacalcarata TaxID=392030 RepID=A0A820GMZ7_9BILA|nr:unnamed protein product [Rotaria magnacalcarata]CAF4334892.1 unnamed protein product [Rotaria magnacalcarata]
MKNKLKHSLLEAAKNKALSISPDNWTDNHRSVAYMGATVHLIDEGLNYQSIDLFCVEFVEKKKTAENIYQLMEKQLLEFGLDQYMDNIYFVTDRGSNFLKAFRSNKNTTKEKITKSIDGINYTTTQIEETPKKKKSNSTKYLQASPEFEDYSQSIDDCDQSEDDSEEEDDYDDDICDYTELTINQLSNNVRLVITTIKSCKSLSGLNRQLQLVQNEPENEDLDGTTNNNKHIVLTELQKTNEPSLFLVLPCITYLRDELASGERKEKSELKFFFYKRASQLLENMFIMEEEYIMAAFLHPNYKQLRGASSSQVAECYTTSRQSIVHDQSSAEIILDNYEPQAKKAKIFMSTLMDKQRQQNGNGQDEVDRYISLTLGEDEQYSNPLDFWKKKDTQLAFPNLFQLAKRYFSIPCSSSAVERQFSAAGQIITQRRANLDPATVNDIIFLRSIENRLV